MKLQQKTNESVPGTISVCVNGHNPLSYLRGARTTELNHLILTTKTKTPAVEDEAERLKVLHSYNILDTDFEKGFDSIAEIAATLCNTPVALVTFLDQDRNWFKAAIGVDARESPRDISFCQHTILGDEVYEVPDATKDELFDESPWVYQSPWLRFYAGAPLVDDNGFKLGAVCVLDLEPRKLSEQQKRALKALAAEAMSQLQLRQLLKKERQLGQLRKNFVSMASHQLRTPLTVVQSNLEILLKHDCKKQTLAPEKIDRISNRVNSELERMMHLIDGVMDSVKSESEVASDEKHLVDVVALAYKVKDRIDQVQRDGRKLKVETLGTPSLFRANHEKIEDILLNLVSNAFKYSKGSEMAPILRLDFKIRGSLVVQVQDFGIGVPAEDIPFLFDPFYRASNTSAIQGTGLGLNIVMKYVQDHNGSMDVVSKPGNTVFEISFPRNSG